VVTPTDPTKGDPFIHQTSSGFKVKWGKRWSFLQKKTKATDTQSVINLCTNIMKKTSGSGSDRFHLLADLHHCLEQIGSKDLSEEDLQQLRTSQKTVSTLALTALSGERGLVDLSDISFIVGSIQDLPEGERSQMARNTLSIFLDGILHGTYDDDIPSALNIAETLASFCPDDPTVLPKLCAVKVLYSEEKDVETVLKETIPESSDDAKQIMLQGHRQFVEIILGKLQDNNIGSNIPSLIRKEALWSRTYGGKYNDSPTKDTGLIRSTFNSLLKNKTLAVTHTMDPGLQERASLEEYEGKDKEAAAAWAKRYPDSQAVTKTFGRAKVCTKRGNGLHEVASKEDTNAVVQASRFHHELFRFYRTKLPPAEYSNEQVHAFVHTLMARMSLEHTFSPTLSQIGTMASPEPYMLSDERKGDEGFSSIHFGFESGIATVSQKNRYRKKDASENQEPDEIFDITHSISLAPGDTSTSWKETLTIQNVTTQPQIKQA